MYVCLENIFLFVLPDLSKWFCLTFFFCVMCLTVRVVLLSAWACVCVCECICMGPLKVIDDRCRRCICPGCVNINLWGWGGYNTPPPVPPSIPPSFSLFTIWLLSDSGPINPNTHTQLSLHRHSHFSTLISWWVQWSLPRFVKTHIFTHISTNTQVNGHVTLTHADTHINPPAVVYCNLSVWTNMYPYVHIWALVKQ